MAFGPFNPEPYDPRKVVGKDVFSFLDFLSPRQGPDETTNPKPPEPPATPGPPPTSVPPPPELPPPVSTRKLEPQIGPAPPPPVLSGAGGTPSLAGGGGADTLPVGPDGQPIVTRPGDPPPVAPPVIDQLSPIPAAPPVGPAPPIAPPLPVSDPGGLKVMPGTPVPKSVNPLPAAPDPGAGADQLMKIYEEQRADAKRQRIGDAIAKAAYGIGAATTRSPSAREALTGMAKSSGSGSGSGTGAASMGDLLNIQKLSAASAQAKADNALIPEIAARSGESEAVIRAMNADDRSKYIAEITSGKNISKVERGDGTVAFVEDRTGRVISTVGADAYKQAERAEKAAAEKRTSDLHPGVLERQGVDLTGERQRQRLADTEEGRKVELQPGVVSQQAATLDKTKSDTRINEAEEVRKTEALNQRLASVDDVAKRNTTIPRNVLESLARIGGEGWSKAVSNDYEVKVLANGTAVAIDKNNPKATPVPLYSDAEAAKKLDADIKSTTSTTATREYDLKKTQEIDLAADDALDDFVETSGLRPTQAAAMTATQRADYLKGQGVDMMTLNRINAERKAKGEPTMTVAEYKASEQADKLQTERVKAGFPVIAKEANEITSKAAAENAAILSSRGPRRQEQALLRQGDLIQGSTFSPAMLEIRKLIGQATKRGDDAATMTEVRSVMAAKDALTLAEQMPGALSNDDRKYLERIAGGDITQSPEATRQIFGIMSRIERKKFLSNNEKIEATNKKMPDEWMKLHGASKPFPVDDEMRRYTDNGELMSMLRDPDNYDYDNGAGAAADYTKNFDKVLETKMQVRGTQKGTNRPTNTYNTADTKIYEATRRMTTEELEQRRGVLEAQFEKDYGVQGRGLFDLMLEGKRKGLFGGRAP